ncbi:MAG TPA: Na+/H+ antiporter [Cyclobacteriaceae bacterium]|nr:Na+/H+ antiporter [Cyclobacteriaceae bacterium]
MNNITIVILLLTVITALSELTHRIKIPYPILLVLVGIVIGLIPGLPTVSLDPDLVFLIFLPPVLYSAAWQTSWPDFKADLRPISLLAIGCVLFTTTMIALIAHTLIPGFGWAESFILGAIISPPDAVAASAATKGLGVPKRIITILEGESLVNDATGLIAYRYAVAAAGTGTFVFWLAGANFFYVAILGIAIGLGMGFVFYWIHKITPDNPTNDTVLTFIAPYASYLTAEHFHASGVLAVVVMGVFLSPRASIVFNHQARLQAYNVWDTVMFILNGLIFILIGLQLPVIMSQLGKFTLWEAIGYGALISGATIILRIIWVFPSHYIPKWFLAKARKQDTELNSKSITVIAWSGMRGVVSLAAALALPLTINNNPFPNRDIILFITFAVIFSTLVLQGLTLPKLIQWLGIKPDGKEEKQEFDARLRVAASIIEHIEENYALSLSDTVLSQIKAKYEIRIEKMRQESVRKMTNEQVDEYVRIQNDLLSAERKFVLDLRKSRVIGDEVHRKLEYELDLEEERLSLERDQPTL